MCSRCCYAYVIRPRYPIHMQSTHAYYSLMCYKLSYPSTLCEDIKDTLQTSNIWLYDDRTWMYLLQIDNRRQILYSIHKIENNDNDNKMMMVIRLTQMLCLLRIHLVALDYARWYKVLIQNQQPLRRWSRKSRSTADNKACNRWRWCSAETNLAMNWELITSKSSIIP